jgi:spermidine synthase
MRFLVPLFFVSGAAGLVYESIWSRELHRIFGTSQFAIATVLAAFMTGLALGGALGGRLAPGVQRPLRTYAALEAMIGVFALGFPAILTAVEPAYLGFFRAFEPGVVAFGTFQFLVLGVVLLLPTAAMGATLPLLVRLVEDREGGRAAGTLYAVNTAGAVVGTWLAGFYLLPDLGVWATTQATATVNLALAGIAFFVDLKGRVSVPVAAASAPTGSAGPDRRWLWVAGLAGFAALGLEVAWFRLLALILGASTYAFSVMLLAFLVGIAAGGEVGGPVADRLAARGRLYLGVFGAQLAVALLTWLVMWWWGDLPLTFVHLYYSLPPLAEALDPRHATAIAGQLLWPAKCLLAAALMAPPAFFMGATFPLLVRAARGRDLSAAVGRVYAANTVGALLGAFLAGFVLLPGLHIRGTVLLCIAVNVVAAAVAVLGAPERARAWRPLAVAGAVLLLTSTVHPRWDPMMMTTGIYKYVDNLDPGATEADIRRQMIDRYELLYYAEGLSSVVTVARNHQTGNVWLANNGKIDASSTTDMPTQLLVSHLPFLFTGDEARSAVVIGLASGITLGAATLHPELERIDVVEIEPSIREATEFFRHVNHDALYDPRVRLIANDGRNQLLLTPPGTYDVIICEPSNPWLSGVSNLFTLEFFEMGRTRLAPGGVWAQWLQMYGMDGRDLKAVMRTFATAFPYAHTFATIEDADLVMIGSERPLQLDRATAAALLTRTPALHDDFERVELHDEWSLLSTWLFSRDQMLGFSETHRERIVDDLRPDDVQLGPAVPVPLNTDDNMLVEFSAPRNLHRETSTTNFLELRGAQGVPVFATDGPDELVELGFAYRERDQLPRALMALKAALGVAPERDDIATLFADWQAELLAGD